MKVYICKKSNINADYTAWESMIDATKMQRINRYKDCNKKRTLILSDHLARYAISKYCGVLEEDIEFRYNSLGKPLAFGLDVNFNISHSGDYVVLVISDKPCGIDIEVIREVNLKTAIRFCTENELKNIENATQKEIEFLKIWTKKEAYFKSVGCGIATELKLLDTTKESGFHTEVTNDYVLTVYNKTKNFERCELIYDKC